MSSTASCNPRVLVFDSGVGGLSIVRAIKQQTNADIIYASDNAAFPYGTKSEATLIERTKNVLKSIQQAAKANIIVIACNTASTVTLPALRESFAEPVIGVVPAIKPAAVLSKSKVIGLLATPGTISRAYTSDLIREFANDCQVISVGSAELVHYTEEKLKGTAIDSKQLIELVQPFYENQQIDTMVLACTHFPLMLEELKTVLPNITYWVDSGGAIARRVNYWISQLGLDEPARIINEHRSFFTQKDDSIERLKNTLMSDGLGNIQLIEMPFNER